MNYQVLQVPIAGMDCVECTQHVKKAISDLQGVEKVEVYLAAEKAVVEMDSELVDMDAIRRAVEGAGYRISKEPISTDSDEYKDYTRAILMLIGIVFGTVLFVIVIGEWFGLFERITELIPWPVNLGLIFLIGYPVFIKVLQAAIRRQVVSHTLMTVGVVAAILAGEWTTAVIVTFFMRVGDFVERFTTERARQAVKKLTALAPDMARVMRNGNELEIRVDQVLTGDMVIVRPGEKIPVDGIVESGSATINNAAVTGESMPVEAGSGSKVYAASILLQGYLQVRAQQIGEDSTFGQVIKLVGEAEANRAEVERVADRFSAYYLPVVITVAVLTFLIRRDPLAVVAVLVVACSCAFALATPIAVLASIGAGAKRGIMIKGGKYLEILSRADVLLIDKTGTLTLGKPKIVNIEMAGSRLSHMGGGLNSLEIESINELLRLTASAEKYSEHPLAVAVREAARERNLKLEEPEEFVSMPGVGVRARVGGTLVEVGGLSAIKKDDGYPDLQQSAKRYLKEGKTLLIVSVDGEPVGLMAAMDTMRAEVPRAIRKIKSQEINRLELLTGDNQQAASALVSEIQQENKTAGDIEILFRAGLMPAEKIRIVKEYQSAGHTVIMVGDGINDAPALAQADAGIAMGAAGSDVAIEAAHVALMRDDWNLVPEAVAIARRTMRVVKMNIYLTAIYNILGISLAAFGILPPVLAAAAQSIPDLGILANSSRLLRQKSF